MKHIPLVAAALATGAMVFAVPATAAPCDDGPGMRDVEYALDVAGAPPSRQDPDIPEPPDPTPYEPDCGVMQSECESDCADVTSTEAAFGVCVDSCMSNAGC